MRNTQMNDDITPEQLTLVTGPCPDCPPSTPRPRPDWRRLESLARLAMAVARADLDAERRERAEPGGAA